MSYPTKIEHGMTNEQVLGPAMMIETQADADAYFVILVAFAMCQGVSREKAEENMRNSLGYYAGYYDLETRKRVEKLFRCQHPIFGPIETAQHLTPKEILDMGLSLGRQSRST